MKCVIPGINIKVFGRAVHSLSKIGDELYVEPLEQGFVLRTVNSTRSAYAYMLFAPSFFTHYDDGSSLIKSEGEDDNEGLRCKVNMKSILTVFKSLSSIEKSVERCKIMLNNQEARLVFQLYCRHGIVKTHNLAFIECETLQAVFSKDLTPNKLTAHPKLLCDAVINFQNNQEEVTLIAKPDKISLKNYVDDEPDQKKVVLTEMHLDPNEFDNYQLGVDTEITFCLKELRAILGFAEVLSLPINIHFERPGRPVVISIDSDHTFEANFVLATLADTDSQSSHPQSVSQSFSKHRQSKPNKLSNISKETHNSVTPSTRTNGYACGTNNQQIPTNEIPDDEFEDDFEEMIYNDPTIDKVTGISMQSTTNKSNKSSCDNRTNTSHVSGKSKSSHTTINQKLSCELSTTSFMERETNSPAETSSNRSGSPIIPFQNEKSAVPHARLNESEMQEVDEDEDDDVIPGTPPSKKFRSMVFGLSQSSTQPSQNTQLANVLAEDTDEED